jgi:hypothetical protein
MGLPAGRSTRIRQNTKAHLSSGGLPGGAESPTECAKTVIPRRCARAGQDRPEPKGQKQCPRHSGSTFTLSLRGIPARKAEGGGRCVESDLVVVPQALEEPLGSSLATAVRRSKSQHFGGVGSSA